MESSNCCHFNWSCRQCIFRGYCFSFSSFLVLSMSFFFLSVIITDISFLFSWPILLLGILVGHLYFFLMFKYPQDFGGPRLLSTPQFL